MRKPTSSTSIAPAGAAIERLLAKWCCADEAVAGMALDDTFDVGGEGFFPPMTYLP
ncbi:MAG: hypothetical protein WAV54_16730 [Acidimicrobiales bacterium]